MPTINVPAQRNSRVPDWLLLTVSSAIFIGAVAVVGIYLGSAILAVLG